MSDKHRVSIKFETVAGPMDSPESMAYFDHMREVAAAHRAGRERKGEHIPQASDGGSVGLVCSCGWDEWDARPQTWWEHFDSLDAAWAEAEAELPSGWWIDSLTRDAYVANFQNGPSITYPHWRASAEGPGRSGRAASGKTRQDALRSLAAELRQSGGQATG